MFPREWKGGIKLIRQIAVVTPLGLLWDREGKNYCAGELNHFGATEKGGLGERDTDH